MFKKILIILSIIAIFVSCSNSKIKKDLDPKDEFTFLKFSQLKEINQIKVTRKNIKIIKEINVPKEKFNLIIFASYNDSVLLDAKKGDKISENLSLGPQNSIATKMNTNMINANGMGKHYVFWDKKEKDTSWGIVKKIGEKEFFIWDISKIQLLGDDHVSKINDYPLSNIYFLIVYDKNSNDIFDEGEFKKVKIIFE